LESTAKVKIDHFVMDQIMDRMTRDMFFQTAPRRQPSAVPRSGLPIKALKEEVYFFRMARLRGPASRGVAAARPLATGTAEGMLWRIDKSHQYTSYEERTCITGRITRDTAADGA
jgi:hypothetical protein